MTLANYSDIRISDIIETYEMREAALVQEEDMASPRVVRLADQIRSDRGGDAGAADQGSAPWASSRSPMSGSPVTPGMPRCSIPCSALTKSKPVRRPRCVLPLV